MEKRLNQYIKEFIRLFNDDYSDLIDSTLNYIYTSLVKNDYSKAYIYQIIDKEIIDDYSLDTINTSEYNSIVEVKETYLKSNLVDDDLKDKIINDIGLANKLLDIEKNLKIILDDKLSDKDIKDIKGCLDDLKSRENKSDKQSDLINIIEPKLNLVSIYGDTNNKIPIKEVYKFDYKINSYIPFTIDNLELLLKKIDNTVRFVPKTYHDMLSRVSITDKIDNNLVELDNVYINQKDYTIINKSMDNIYFTDKRLMYDDIKNNRLYYYDKDLTVDNIPKEVPIALKTLQQITIPKDNQSDVTIFRFILQLIGASISGKNILKLLPIFYDDGNKGKTTLLNILALIFKDGISTLNKKVLNDNFLVETLNNTKYCFVNDEFKFKEFNSYNNEYKFLSGYGFYSSRGFRSNQNKKVNGTALAFLFTNDDPIIDLDDKALIKRINIITLPNKFIENKGDELGYNEYHQNKNIIHDISLDYQGLSMIISLAINEYYKVIHSDNIDKALAFKQSDKEKIRIISKDDPLLTFLIMNCKENHDNVNQDNYLRTDDILNGFNIWYNNFYGEAPPNKLINDLDSKGNNKVKASLGTKIRNTYPNIDKTNSHPIAYNLKILGIDEANKEKNMIIEILSDDTYRLNDLEIKIINLISKGYNTKNKIIGELPNRNNLEVLKTIDNLSDKGNINITSILNMIE